MLQGARGYTAEELSRELEVCRRTIFRDLVVTGKNFAVRTAIHPAKYFGSVRRMIPGGYFYDVRLRVTPKVAAKYAAECN